MEQTEYLAIMNVTLSFPCVISGTLQDVNTGEVRPADHMVLDVAPKTGPSDLWLLHLGKGDVGDKWLLTGGIIHVGLPDKFRVVWEGMGAITPLGKNVHVNLLEVFPEDVAGILNSNDIWTLEDVVADKVTTLPLTTLGGNPITRPLRELLLYAAGGNEHMVEGWYQAARNIVKADEVPSAEEGDDNASIG